MVLSLAKPKDQSARLLKHVVRCYLRLSDNPRWALLFDRPNLHFHVIQQGTVNPGWLCELFPISGAKQDTNASPSGWLVYSVRLPPSAVLICSVCTKVAFSTDTVHFISLGLFGQSKSNSNAVFLLRSLANVSATIRAITVINALLQTSHHRASNCKKCSQKALRTQETRSCFWLLEMKGCRSWSVELL